MPDWRGEVLRRLTGLSLPPGRAIEIADELTQHLEDRHADLLADGASAAEAERLVLAELHDHDLLAQALRQVERPDRAVLPPGAPRRHLFLDLGQDLRLGLRALRRQPGFTAVAVLALALGIGGNTAIFSLVNGVLLKALPFREPDRLMLVTSRRTDPGKRPFTLPDFIDFRDQNRSLDDLAAFATWNVTLTGQGDAERLLGARVSAGAFGTLGVEAVAGRTLQPDDDTPGRQFVVVLGHGLWQRRFAADPAIVGKTLTFNDTPYTVVGVLPPQFVFPIRDAELMTPLAPDADPWRGMRSSVNFLRGIARLKPGVSREVAQADLTAVAERLRRDYPASNGQKVGVDLTPLGEDLVGDYRAALVILLAAVGTVLLITCVNLANLALARASGRRREMAIRAALGAGRGRLVQQLLTENLLLAALGGLAGLALAYHGIPVLLALSPATLPRVAEVAIDRRVLGFTLSLSVLAGLTFGLLPAWRATRVDLEEALREGGRGLVGGRRQARARGLLVVAQIALSLVLLVAAGLLLRSFARLQSVSPGFDTDNVLAIHLSLPQSRYPDRAAISRFTEALQGRLETLPGVEAVGCVSLLPLSGWGSAVPFTIEGRDAPAGEEMVTEYRLASPGYFSALGIPRVAGRGFDAHDTATTGPVAIVSHTFAKRFWPDGNPVGAHLRIDDNDRGPRAVTVVGVAGDVRDRGLDAEPSPILYLPIEQVHEDGVVWLTNQNYWLLRSAVDPLTLREPVRRAIQAVDRDAPSSDIRPMEQYLQASVAPRRFNLWLLTLFAGAALVLAGTGLYGVIAYGVAQRRHEIGIRMTLGATGRDVLRLVLGEGMRLLAAGAALGLVAAWGVTRFMAALLFDVSATDPSTYLTISAILGLVALLACYLPARRAAAVDPLVALRSG
ncbi:MAG TPA: ABC transporter permease [Dongiaceae bacterium]|nr:ABC transporter permease [Dongiaceae bacterium]